MLRTLIISEYGRWYENPIIACKGLHLSKMCRNVVIVLTISKHKIGLFLFRPMPGRGDLFILSNDID